MKTVKVFSYNIGSTIGADDKADFRRSAEVMKQYRPDVAGIEEIGVFTKRVPGVDAPLEIARYTRMNYLFSRALYTTPEGGQYGIAAFSPCAMEVAARILLPVPQGAEPRTALIVKVLDDQPYYFCVTHFSFQAEFDKSEFYRALSLKLITDTIEDGKFFPCILTGDLNTFAGTETVDFLHEKYLVANDAEPMTPTFPAKGTEVSPHHNSFGKQIDFICAYPKNAWEIKSFKVCDVPDVSDHNPVFAELVLK